MFQLANINSLPEMLGQAIFYASTQASLGSVAMSSTFSVKNFSKDQAILDNAADALREYMYIASFWTIAAMLVLYSQYGVYGSISGLLTNLGYILWIYCSYMKAFKESATKYKLKVPVVFV